MQGTEVDNGEDAVNLDDDGMKWFNWRVFIV